jgi:hypothetical protein
MKRNANNEYAIPDGLGLFEDQNSLEHVSDDPSDLVLVLMAKGSPDRDAKCPSEDFLSPLNHLDSMEPTLIRGRGFHCGRARTGRGTTAIT